MDLDQLPRVEVVEEHICRDLLSMKRCTTTVLGMVARREEWMYTTLQFKQPTDCQWPGRTLLKALTIPKLDEKRRRSNRHSLT